MSKIEVNQIDTISGSSTLLVGPSAATKLTFSSTLTVDFNVNSPGVTLNDTMKNTPIFQVYKSADQSISNAAFTTVTFDTELYDTGGAFASNTFTAPETGYYYIYSQLVWSGSTNSNYSLNRLMKNGNPVNWNAFFQTEDSGGYGGRIIHLSSSDTVTVQCYQDSGGSLSLRGSGEDECQFGGYKLIGA